jgi:Tfp pilus assembly protein PilO
MATLTSFTDLNFSALIKTRRHLVAAAAFGITALILFVLAYQQAGRLFATRAALTAEQRKVAQLNQKAQELEQLRLSPEFAQAEQMNRVLPSHKPLLELLNNLNSVAGETQVSITEFEINPGEIATDSTQVATSSRPASQKSTADYDRLDLKLTIVGELAQIRRFMDLIERVSPITTITNLTVDRKVGGAATTTTTRADLSLSTYYYTKPIASTLSSALPEISAREREVFQAILDFTPAEVEAQTEIITGSNQDLFGINGLNVIDLETQLNGDEL